MRRGTRWLLAAATVPLVSLLVPDGVAQAAAPYTAAPVPGSLSAYNISRVYVSGVSSGGYMATQLQVAYSQTFSGAAVFSAGPYYCAQDNVYQALNACSANTWPDDLSTLESDTSYWSSLGWIDPAGNLAGQPVYVYHGTNDTTVQQSVANDLVRYYQHFGASVTYDSTSPAGHAWVTPYGPNACSATASPYLNNCGTDPEHTLLATLFGSVNAPNTGPLTGTLIDFDQNTFAVGGYASGLSMGNDGFVYVPASCAAGQACRLMVALHGCMQGYDAIGTAFIDDANLNQYADTNNMIVLYPQATATAVNPDGCWDWWGYLGGGDTDYPIHGGAQIETIMSMVRALGG